MAYPVDNYAIPLLEENCGKKTEISSEKGVASGIPMSTPLTHR